IAKVDKEVHDALHDDLRFRADGLTKEELAGLEELQKLRDAKAEIRPMRPESPDPVQRMIDDTRRAMGWEYAETEPEGPAIGSFSLTEPTSKITGRDPQKVDTIGSTTVEKALAEINLNRVASYGKDDPFDAPLGLHARELRLLADKIAEFAKDVKIHIVRDEDAPINYGLTAWARKGWDLVSGKDGAPDWYDPLTHQIVMREFIYGGSPAFSARAILHESVHAATTRAINAFPEVRKHIRDLMNDMELQVPEIVKEYGFVDESEFLAEAISNPTFQKQL